MNSVPFTIDNMYEGLAETEGILSVEGADLKPQFQTKDGLLGAIKSGLHEIRLPLDT